jgi:basic type II keratin
MPNIHKNVTNRLLRFHAHFFPPFLPALGFVTPPLGLEAGVAFFAEAGLAAGVAAFFAVEALGVGLAAGAGFLAEALGVLAAAALGSGGGGGGGGAGAGAGVFLPLGVAFLEGAGLALGVALAFAATGSGSGSGFGSGFGSAFFDAGFFTPPLTFGSGAFWTRLVGALRGSGAELLAAQVV